jgi:hypothetical protein
MSSQTPNLNLVLPVGTEHVSRQIINDNNTKIDTAVGANSTAIAKVQNGLAYIVGDTNTTGGTLAVGQFVYVKNHSSIAEGLRKVTADIAANGSITTNNTTDCTEGGLNALNSKVVYKDVFAMVGGVTYGGGGHVSVSYPAGFNKGNCCVVSSFGDLYDTRYTYSAIVYTRLETNNIDIYCPGGSDQTQFAVFAMLMKTSF